MPHLPTTVLAQPEFDEALIDKEWRKCRKSLLYYLTHYVYIQDRVNNCIERWNPEWKHQLELVNLVQAWADKTPREPMYIVIFKSRQVGASTTICGIGNWLMLSQSSKVIYQSKDERTAGEMLDRSKFIADHHPPYLRLKMFPNQDDIIGFPATNSKMVTVASKDDAGRATDATFVACDEWENHPFAREGFAAIKPPIDRGGLFIGASTVKKTDASTFPKEIWYGAKEGRNAFIPIFWDYFVVPGRDERTYHIHTAGMPDWQKEQEYPRSEKEALSPPKSVGVFNHDALEKMLQEVRNPVDERYGGKVKIYTPSSTSRKFIFAIDSSQGMDDPSVGIISDTQTGEDAAYFRGKISLDEQAKLAYELYKEYNEPLIAVERNACGLTLIEKLINLGVKNWYYQDEQAKKLNKPGWYTPMGTIREKMVNEYAEEINLRRKRIPNKDCVLEHFNFVWLDNKAQARQGAHDDFVMCEAIVNQMLKDVPKNTPIKFYNFKYK